jgi:hypothetical protein
MESFDRAFVTIFFGACVFALFALVVWGGLLQ